MANKRLAATITIGGAVASSLTGAFGSVKDGVGKVGGALRKLEAQQRTLSQAIQTFGALGKNVDGMRARYALLAGQVDKLRVAHERLNRIENAQRANMAKRADYRGQMLDTAALAVTAAAPIRVAADRETHALGIAKQMKGARDESGNLTAEFWAMRKAVVELGHEIPMATNDLLDMATAGLRMDVAKEEILGFTRNTAKLASALELPAEQVADQFGKIKNVYKLSLDDLASLGDTVNYLDDQNTVKGGELIDYLQRVGGSAGAAKVTAKQMAAIGTTLISMGESAETAGTSTKAMFTRLQAGAKGTKKARAALAELGLNPEAVSKGMQKNAIGTIQEVMARINKIAPEKRAGIISDIFTQDHVGQILKLATGTKEFATALEQANGAAANGSVQKEFNNTVGSTNSHLAILKNQLGDVADNIGTVLLPAVNEIATVLGKASKTVANFAQEHPLLTKVVVGTAVAMVGLRVATLATGYAFTFLKGGALQLAGALAGARAKMLLTTVSTRAMGLAATTANGGLLGMATRALPLVANGVRMVGVAFVSTGIGAIITGIAVGGLLIYKNWDMVKSFFAGFGSGVVSGIQPVLDAFKGLYESMGFLKPVIDGIGKAVGAVWDWFTKLLDPVTHTPEQLQKATSAGETFGKIVGGAMNFVLTPMRKVIEGITWIGNNAGAILDKVGGAISKAKSALGFGDDAAAATVGSAVAGLPGAVSLTAPGGKPSEGLPGISSPLPAVPPMATAKGAGGQSYIDQSKTDIHVTQQPGQSTRQLAEEVTRIQEEKRAARQRGAMHDGAT